MCRGGGASANWRGNGTTATIGSIIIEDGIVGASTLVSLRTLVSWGTTTGCVGNGVEIGFFLIGNGYGVYVGGGYVAHFKICAMHY